MNRKNFDGVIKFGRSKKSLQKIIALFLVFSLVLPILPETAKVQANTVAYHNTEIIDDSTSATGKKVTWKCVWLGSYPQKEITPEDSVYSALQKATSWDENGDVWYNKKKYRRILKKDATYVDKEGRDIYYQWEDDSTYHYFQYEPIKWRVLEEDDDEQWLLMSDIILDCQKYNATDVAVSWNQSILRSWLNGYNSAKNKAGINYSKHNFYDTAFSRMDKASLRKLPFFIYDSDSGWKDRKIEDYVLLLSNDDVRGTVAERYGFYCKQGVTNRPDLRCAGSDYARAMGVPADTLQSHWFVTPSSDTSKVAGPVPVVNGVASNTQRYNASSGIRPVLWFEPAERQDAGTVCSDGTIAEIAYKNEFEEDYQEYFTWTVSEQNTVTGKVQNGISISVNQSSNDYDFYNRENILSYLETDNDGTMTRVEAVPDGIAVEKYDKDGKIISAHILDKELPKFGGYFCGENFRFLVFGQDNEKESDEQEVIRIVKYDKAWKRLGSVSIYGANTFEIFCAGTLRMAESNGILFIHTCHTMYDGGDGNHQANMSFVIDEGNLSVMLGRVTVSAFNGDGYVSHSLDQFVQTDGQYFYRLDLGDAHPRAIAVSKMPLQYIREYYNYELRGIAGLPDIKTGILLTIPDNSDGTHYNYTGVSLGGFEVTGEKLVAVGTSANRSNLNKYIPDDNSNRNIFVISVDKTAINDDENAFLDDKETVTTFNWLTSYSKKDKVTVNPPVLVKAAENELYMMWEEIYQKKYTTKIVKIDKNGQMVSKIKTMKARLSDCQPQLTSDGELLWYVTDGKTLTFYKASTTDLGKLTKTQVSIIAKVNGLEYQIKRHDVETDIDGIQGQVIVVRVENSLAASVNVPATVTLKNGCKYEVVSIADKVCTGNTKLKNVTIGKNIESIGSKAFFGCKNLKNITIKSEKLTLKSVGDNAFKNIAAKAVVKVPKNKKNAYRKILQKKGAGKKIVVK